MHSDDEIFESSGVKRVHQKSGYIDGKAEWSERGLQVSFDKGYPVGAQLGWDVGHVIAKFQMLIWHSAPEKRAILQQRFDACVEEMKISSVLDTRYFNDGEIVGKLHPIVAKWKSEVDELSR